VFLPSRLYTIVHKKEKRTILRDKAAVFPQFLFYFPQGRGNYQDPYFARQQKRKESLEAGYRFGAVHSGGIQ
jgi:hypothetical protein